MQHKLQQQKGFYAITTWPKNIKNDNIGKHQFLPKIFMKTAFF